MSTTPAECVLDIPTIPEWPRARTPRVLAAPPPDAHECVDAAVEYITSALAHHRNERIF